MTQRNKKSGVFSVTQYEETSLFQANVKKYFLLAAIFSTGIIVGFILWDKLKLPFDNPNQTPGILATLQLNPSNNVLRFVVFVGLPALLLFGAYLFGSDKLRTILFSAASSEPQDGRVHKIIAGGLILFSLLASVNIITYTSSQRFDPFHEGESLGSAVFVEHDQIPYKDFVFTHGLYEDPLRSVLAFKLFGRSIGAARTMQSLNKLLAFFLLAIFLIQVFRDQIAYAFLIPLLLYLFQPTGNFNHAKILDIPHVNPLIVPAREMTLFSFLALIPVLKDFLNRRPVSQSWLFLIFFLFSFIPSVSFVYSLDRAMYLLAAYAVLWPLLFGFFFRKDIFRKSFLAASAIGLSAGVLILATLIRWNFKDFFEFLFFIGSKDIGLQFNYAFPVDFPPYFILCVMVAANFFWVANAFFQEMRACSGCISEALSIFLKKHLIEFSLLILSLLSFKSALGRCDWMHVAYVTPLTWILSIVILTKRVLFPVLSGRPLLSKTVTLGVLLVAGFSSFGFIQRISDRGLLAQSFPLKVKDSQFIPENYKKTIAFLKETMKEGEVFFTLTSELSWYYFLDQASPTQIPLVVHAVTPKNQSRIVEDLKAKNVKYILYDNSNGTNENDGFTNETRFPIVVDFIKQNYRLLKIIDDNVLLIKK